MKTIIPLNKIPNEIRMRFQLEIQVNKLSIPILQENGNEIARIEGVTDLWQIQNLTKRTRISRQAMAIGKSDKKAASFYNLDSIVKPADPLIITLSIPAVWLLWKFGFANALGVLSKSIDENDLTFIDSIVKKNAKILVLTDKTTKQMQSAVAISGKLSLIRFTRHLVSLSPNVLTCSPSDLQEVFNSL